MGSRRTDWEASLTTVLIASFFLLAQPEVSSAPMLGPKSGTLVVVGGGCAPGRSGCSGWPRCQRGSGSDQDEFGRESRASQRPADRHATLLQRLAEHFQRLGEDQAVSIGDSIPRVDVKQELARNGLGAVREFDRLARVDLALRGFEAVAGSAATVPAQPSFFNRRISDHDFVTCEVKI